MFASVSAVAGSGVGRSRLAVAVTMRMSANADSFPLIDGAHCVMASDPVAALFSSDCLGGHGAVLSALWSFQTG